MKLQTRNLTPWLLAAAVLTLAGCSGSPTAPILPNADQASPGMPAEGTLIGRTETGDTREDSGTQFAVGVQGAVLHYGRFTVNVPSGAVPSQVVVILGTDDTGLALEMSVSPKIDLFAVPVAVSADVAGLFHPGRIKNTFLSQWDASSQAWVRLSSSQMTMSSKKVSGSSQVCATFRIENRGVTKNH